MKQSGTIAAALVVAYCREKGYPEPVAEHRFHDARKWRFDLAWVESRVAVEFQGGNWGTKRRDGTLIQGGHTRGKGFESDCEKFTYAAVLGWRVLPVTYKQVEQGLLYEALDTIFGASHDGVRAVGSVG